MEELVVEKIAVEFAQEAAVELDQRIPVERVLRDGVAVTVTTTKGLSLPPGLPRMVVVTVAMGAWLCQGTVRHSASSAVPRVCQSD